MNPYEILEIDPSASLEEIQRAYRKLVRKYHPDKNKNPDAPLKFRQVHEAYVFLKHKKSKPAEKSQEDHTRGRDLKVTINVDINEVIRGLKKTFTSKRRGLCPKCDGTGSKLKKRKKCVFCGGTGLRGLDLVLGQKKRCLYCTGIGTIIDGEKCSTCNGEAVLSEETKHSIKLSPLNATYKIPHQGNYSIGFPEPGDLYVDLIISQDTNYRVQGLDIIGSLNISPAQAIVGDTLYINVFGKKISITITPGVRNNSIVFIEQGGINFENRTGSLKLKIQVELPVIFTQDELELYRKILAIEKGQSCQKTLTI